MRSLWSGAISFGLVNIPVQIYSGAIDHSLDFDMLHKEDLSPIRFARICKAEGKEVPYKDIIKGYKLEDDEYVVVTEEDFKNASAGKSRAIDLFDFTEEAKIDTMLYEKPYFLEPGKGASKAYKLLFEALKKSKKVGIAKFVMREREHLAVIKPYHDILVLMQLRYHDEIRDYSELKLPKEKISEKEIQLALKLIDQLTAPFHPEEFSDTYVDNLRSVIENKAKGIKPKKVKERKIATTGIKDLMSVLKQSLEKTGKAAPKSRARA